MSNGNSLTLANIGKLIDKKLTLNNVDLAKMMDDKLARNNVPIFDAIDSSEERLRNEIKGEIKGLRTEMNQRFDTNDDAHQEILKVIEEVTDAKIARHCKTYHNVVV